MGKQKMTPVGIACVLIILLVVAFVVRGSLRQPERVVLPPEPSRSDGSGTVVNEEAVDRVEIRPDTNEVVVGDMEANLSHSVMMRQINFMGEAAFEKSQEYLGKIRYNHPGASCHVYHRGDDLYECVFEEPQRGVTPGQALVLYRDGMVAGGGTICKE